MAEGWMGSTGRPQLCSALLGLQLSSPSFSCLLLQCEHCTLCSVAAEEKGSSPRQHLLSPRLPSCPRTQQQRCELCVILLFINK